MIRDRGYCPKFSSKMRLGRTTIAIAHRLSTIQDANCIYVLGQGSHHEHCSHEELLALGGTLS